MVQTALKHIVARTYKPWLLKHLSKTRMYRYGDITLEIPPEVFHPGFFFSTRLLLGYIKKLPLAGKRFLELGCGSGLISIVAARAGAEVTATDINPVAVESLEKNSIVNNADLRIIKSDLFKNIPVQVFDMIAINPPYYTKQPLTARDYAWYCGEQGEYFSELFAGIRNYRQPSSEVLMVLFDGCDMNMIRGAAARNGFVLTCVHSRRNLLEENFIFKIMDA